jgi:hypothetical protein
MARLLALSSRLCSDILASPQQRGYSRVRRIMSFIRWHSPLEFPFPPHRKRHHHNRLRSSPLPDGAAFEGRLSTRSLRSKRQGSRAFRTHPSGQARASSKRRGATAARVQWRRPRLDLHLGGPGSAPVNPWTWDRLPGLRARVKASRGGAEIAKGVRVLAICGRARVPGRVWQCPGTTGCQRGFWRQPVGGR